MKLSSTWALAVLVAQAAGAAISHKLNGFTITEHPDPVKRAELQKYVCRSAFESFRMLTDGA